MRQGSFFAFRPCTPCSEMCCWQTCCDAFLEIYRRYKSKMSKHKCRDFTYFWMVASCILEEAQNPIWQHCRRLSAHRASNALTVWSWNDNQPMSGMSPDFKKLSHGLLSPAVQDYILLGSLQSLLDQRPTFLRLASNQKATLCLILWSVNMHKHA